MTMAKLYRWSGEYVVDCGGSSVFIYAQRRVTVHAYRRMPSRTVAACILPGWPSPELDAMLLSAWSDT